MIRQVAAGVYTYMPLAWRSLRKIEEIIRQEMDAAGSHEVRMPALNPMELWEESGRRDAFGRNLFALEDGGRGAWCWHPPTRRSSPRRSRPTSTAIATCPRSCTRFRPSSGTKPGPGRPHPCPRVRYEGRLQLDADDEGLDRSYELWCRHTRTSTAASPAGRAG